MPSIPLICQALTSSIFKNTFTNDLPKYNTNFNVSQFEEFTKVMQSTNISAKDVAKTMDFEVNPAFISYAENTDRTKLSTTGLDDYIKNTNKSFVQMSIKSKIASIGVGLLNGAMSAGISLLASYVFTAVIKELDNLYESTAEIAEAADKARSKIDELHNALKTEQDLVKTSAQRYAELAQGVNQFTGENVSLPTDEYNEFLSLSSKLAETFPALSRNYTTNGDAIVGLKGDVDSIVGSLEALIEKNRELTNVQIAEEAPAVFKGIFEQSEAYKEKIAEYKEDLKSERTKSSSINKDLLTDLNDGTIEIANDDIQKMYATRDAYKELFNAVGITHRELLESNAFYDGKKYPVKFTLKINDEDVQAVKDHLATSTDEIASGYQEKINELSESINAENEKNKANWSSLSSSLFAWLSTDDTYKVLSDEMQAVTQKIAGSIDWSTALYNGLPVDDWSDVEGYVRNNILNIFTKIPDTMQTEFIDLMSSGLPTGQLINEYIQLISDIITQLGLEGDKAEETKQQFINLIASDQDLLQRSRNKINTSVSNGYDKQNKYDWLDTLDSTDLELLLTLDIDKDMSLANIQSALEEAKELAKRYDIDFEPIYAKLEKLKTSYQTVSKAVEEYAENKYLTYDTLQALLQLEDKYLVGLMDENGQLQLNKDSFKALAEAQLQELSISIIKDTIDTVQDLKDEKAAADYLKNSTIDLTEVRWKDAAATFAQARANLAKEKSEGKPTTNREAALDQIEETATTKIELIKNTIGNLSTYFNEIFKDDGDTKTKFSEQIDWSANSLSNLNNEMDGLKEKLANTFNISDKLDIYTDLKTLNEQIVSATLQSSSAYETAWTNASGKISSHYKNMIMSGKEFSVEDFKDEKTYKKVTAAQEAWEKYQQSIKDYNSALISQQELKKEESNAIIAEKEAQLSILDMQLESAYTADDKNRILDDQLKLQKEINDELEKQAILEGNTTALAQLAEKEKQQEKDNLQKKRDNDRAQNQVYIDEYKQKLEDKSLTKDEIDSANRSLRNYTNKDFEYEFEDIRATINDQLWDIYIQDLKKKYKKTKMSDADFIKEHIDEIAAYFDYTGMAEWLSAYYASEEGFEQANYDTAKNARLYSINDNDRKIQDIQNDIDLNGGIGTKAQYSEMICLSDDNITTWTEQLTDAEKRLKGLAPDTAEWDEVNAEIQDIKNNINACESATKEFNSSILNLSLKAVQDQLDIIADNISEIDKQISEQDEYIAAANIVLDEQIEFQEKQKEIIQDQIDALQKEHDLRESNLNVQKAEWNLQKAKNNQTTKVKYMPTTIVI